MEKLHELNDQGLCCDQQCPFPHGSCGEPRGWTPLACGCVILHAYQGHTGGWVDEAEEKCWDHMG